ncbi:MAG: DUF2911 domain-containing protein [Saprospiraceae bacterium]
MKNVWPCFLWIGLLFTACNNTPQTTEDHAAHQHQETASAETPAAKPKSPRMQAMANIGDTHVHIDYSAPSVRGRNIWNGLVAYDQVWVTGAHKATSIDFSTDVTINGQPVPKGKYGFFTIPGEKEWTLILNKNHEQHLADDYDPAMDVVRMKVQSQSLSDNVEMLQYEVIPGAGKTGTIAVSWEKIKVELPITGS